MEDVEELSIIEGRRKRWTRQIRELEILHPLSTSDTLKGPRKSHLLFEKKMSFKNTPRRGPGPYLPPLKVQ